MDIVGGTPNSPIKVVSKNVPHHSDRTEKSILDAEGKTQVIFDYRYEPDNPNYCDLTKAERSQEGTVSVYYYKIIPDTPIKSETFNMDLLFPMEVGQTRCPD